jgi:uncharacterized protein YutE (UPF0331/DUF86 family)
VLSSLKDKGLITEEEYKELRKKNNFKAITSNRGV